MGVGCPFSMCRLDWLLQEVELAAADRGYRRVANVLDQAFEC